ncbi:DEDD exonuclease domain-containing protein [Motilibacter aurantiacus]|uniref:DEDD exonuclease domain-containing protein n=1 Tax=Motilibacter aurantiacus TaxID=2714955 RepID=UPI00140B3411|nr:DEDD exonuclease domain-containing protein [Motilibacter aurantiacus]NHC44876.1 DEDD exonuclease domain-containing protein [Motilibacter aurantiacus]
MSASPAAPPNAALQGTFDELGTPLRETTFVVVDLETTGGSPQGGSRITEIGAVKVRGGQRLGEFQTLVDPGCPVPAFVAVLTGITDSMLYGQPRIETVLPAFLEWCGPDVVLVAHNAPFDTGFLRFAADEAGIPWPSYAVVDTARLARQLVSKDESPNCKLSSLARVFGSATTPNHRALEDARATVDVLHGMLERLGGIGVHSLEELSTFTSRVTPQQRRKRYLADALPSKPGVYVFRDAKGKALYVGTSKDLRSRVRTYFTASEPRRRMAEMVGLAEKVDAIVCATSLEAQVRELRLIAELRPRYNRRSKFPERSVWLKLTDEAFPRLSIVRQVRDDGGSYLGPFGSTRTAERARDAVHQAFRIRQCNARLSPRKATPACALAEMGRCGAPCDGRESVEEYAVHAAAVRAAFRSDARDLAAVLERRIERLSEQERFEDAAAARDRLAAFVRGAARTQRLAALAASGLLVAARPRTGGGWDLAAVRWGRLVGSCAVPRQEHPAPHIEAMLATAESVTPGPGPLPCSLAEEAERVLDWLEQPGTRLVELEGTWASPAYGAGGLRGRYEVSDADVVPFADKRGLRPGEHPAAAWGAAG